MAKANENTYQAGVRLYLPKTMWKRPLKPDDAPFLWKAEPYLKGTDRRRLYWEPMVRI